MSIRRISSWFQRAFPNPTGRTPNVQMGVHVEEFSEMLASLNGEDAESERRIREAEELIEKLADSLKTGAVKIVVADRVELLDSLCDQIVTATGVAHMVNADIISALNEVAASNDSKFDENGMPIFDKNGKITKGPNYFRPELLKYLR